MRWLVSLATGVVGACAAAPAPAPTPVPPPIQSVEVAPPPVAASVDTTALKTKADEAVVLAAQKIVDIGRVACGEQWLETNVACPESEFAQLAADYQAYYSERGDARHESGSYWSLPRLGGATRTVEQVTADLAAGCEDGCRAQRNASISAALDEAAEACKKAPSGFAACKALEKRLSKNVRASEVERWEGMCEGRCENHRASVRYAAEVDRKRPKTPAEAARCQAACRKTHEDAWCGTGLISCLSQCTPKGQSTPRP